MPVLERIQVPERDEIITRALDAGVPEDLARYLGAAGGESRVASDIYPTANYLTLLYVADKQREDGVAAASLPELLLEHFPGIAAALIPEEGQRQEVLGLWETESGQRQWLQTVIDRAQDVHTA